MKGAGRGIGGRGTGRGTKGYTGKETGTVNTGTAGATGTRGVVIGITAGGGIKGLGNGGRGAGIAVSEAKVITGAASVDPGTATIGGGGPRGRDSTVVVAEARDGRAGPMAPGTGISGGGAGVEGCRIDCSRCFCCRAATDPWYPSHCKAL